MSALPRGICPDCGRNVALRKGGFVREHERPRLGVFVMPPPRGGVCSGSGKQAVRGRSS